MGTKTSIATIKSTLLKPSLTSFFEVKIGIPSGLSSWLGIRERDLNLLCSEVSLPGSSLATTEITNDFHGVTERHAYRRIFEEQTDFTFYVDSSDYTPIKFFERWIEYIVDGVGREFVDGVGDQTSTEDLKSNNYFYRMRYPDGPSGYTCDQGLEVRKFERDLKYTGLTYNFVKSYPVSITSMPVSYDGSDVLKCTVAMTYIRYVVNQGNWEWSPSLSKSIGNVFNPFTQSQFNAGGFTGMTANLVNAVVDNATGSDFAGDVAGGLAGRLLRGL